MALQSMSLWQCCNAQGNSMTLLELLHPHLCSILSLARRAAWLVASDMGNVQGIAPPDGLDEQQKSAWQKDSVFLSQLLDNTKVWNAIHTQCLACSCTNQLRLTGVSLFV